MIRSKLAFGIALAPSCMLEAELDEVLARPRYARRAKLSSDASEEMT